MSDKKAITTEEKKEKRQRRIEQLRAKLQQEEARLSEDKRKDRNGQLVAFGVLVEEMFKASEPESRQKWIDGAKKHLSERNLARALAGFIRLEGK